MGLHQLGLSSKSILFSFGLAALTIAPATVTGTENAVAQGALPVGTEVPAFMLPVINDFQVDGKAQRRFGPGKWVGDKPQKKLLMMSFFATWCEPCKKEMPELARLYSKYKDDGLGVMLVSIDKGKEKRSEVLELANSKNVTFPVVHDRFQVVARRYYTSKNISLPYMLIVDANGKVKQVHSGFTEEMKESLEAEVVKELGLSEKKPELDAETAPPAAEKMSKKNKPTKSKKAVKAKKKKAKK